MQSAIVRIRIAVTIWFSWHLNVTDLCGHHGCDRIFLTLQWDSFLSTSRLRLHLPDNSMRTMSTHTPLLRLHCPETSMRYISAQITVTIANARYFYAHRIYYHIFLKLHCNRFLRSSRLRLHVPDTSLWKISVHIAVTIAFSWHVTVMDFCAR